MVSGLNYTVLIITFVCVDERLRKTWDVVSVLVTFFDEILKRLSSIVKSDYSNCSRLQASTSLSARSFCESILFLHLKALRGGELHMMRTVGMVAHNN